MVENYYKSPLNYIGGKYKLLPQIISYIPSDISVFIDLFGGGFNVGANVEAEKIIYNDHETPLVELFKYFYTHQSDEIVDYVKDIIEENNLSKTDKETYYQFREKYNDSSCKKPLDLYVLQCFSFNYQIRFNNSGEYNSSHGTNRSCFSKNMENRLEKFVKKIHEKNIIFYNKDFTELNLLNALDQNSLVYCDPPYLITNGSYNDGNRGFKNWTIREERTLLNLLDKLNENNIRFMLENVFVHDGKQNKCLQQYIDNNNFNIVNIDSDYSNCNYKKTTPKNKRKTHEVLIMNY